MPSSLFAFTFEIRRLLILLLLLLRAKVLTATALSWRYIAQRCQVVFFFVFISHFLHIFQLTNQIIISGNNNNLLHSIYNLPLEAQKLVPHLRQRLDIHKKLLEHQLSAHPAWLPKSRPPCARVPTVNTRSILLLPLSLWRSSKHSFCANKCALLRLMLIFTVLAVGAVVVAYIVIFHFSLHRRICIFFSRHAKISVEIAQLAKLK